MPKIVMMLDLETIHELTIVKYPHKVLRQRAREITVFDETLEQLSLKMIEIMHETKGVGLAANQVGIAIQGLAAAETDDHIRALVPRDLRDAGRFGLGRVAAEFDIDDFQLRGLEAGENAFSQEAFQASVPQDQGLLANFADVAARFPQHVAALQIFSRRDKGEVHWLGMMKISKEGVNLGLAG